MPKDWREIAEISARTNRQLMLENAQLRRERDALMHKTREALTSAIVPESALEELSAELESMSDEELESWFTEENEEEDRSGRLEQEVHILEPTVEQMLYWGDSRDERDRQVRETAKRAIDLLRQVRGGIQSTNWVEEAEKYLASSEKNTTSQDVSDA